MSILNKINGAVAGVYLGDRPGTLVSTAHEQVQVDFAGFVGDQHAGLTRKSDSRTPHYARGTEIRNDRQGAPSVVLSGGARELMERAGIGRWHVTISHCRCHAVAYVIAEGGE